MNKKELEKNPEVAWLNGLFGGWWNTAAWFGTPEEELEKIDNLYYGIGEAVLTKNKEMLMKLIEEVDKLNKNISDVLWQQFSYMLNSDTEVMSDDMGKNKIY